MRAEIAKFKATQGKLPRTVVVDPSESDYMCPSLRPRSTLDETDDAAYDFCFTPGTSNDKTLPNNLATALTLPCRGNPNIQYNNTVVVPRVPESPKYKTLVFIKQ